MIIRLTEEQLLSIINKRINEAMSENFSFDMLKSIRSLKGRLKYCKEHLGLRTKLTRKATNFSHWMNCDKNNSMKILIFTKNYIYIVYRQLTENL